METAKSPEKLIASYREDNAYLKRAFDRQEEYICVLQQQLAAAQTENTYLHMQAELAWGQVKSLQSDWETALFENKTLRAENEAVQAQLSAMTAQFQSIENSTIWRATKPLRTVLDFIRRQLKGSK